MTCLHPEGPLGVCLNPMCECRCPACEDARVTRAAPFNPWTEFGPLPPNFVPPLRRPRAPIYSAWTRLTIGDAAVAPNGVATFPIACKHVTLVRRLYVAVARPDDVFLTSVIMGERTLLERRDDGLSSRRFLEGEHLDDPIGPYETLPQGAPISVSVRNKFRDHQTVHVYAITSELVR